MMMMKKVVTGEEMKSNERKSESVLLPVWASLRPGGAPNEKNRMSREKEGEEEGESHT